MDSNDSLYAGDRKLVAEVAKIVHTLLEQILEHMRSLTTSDEVSLSNCIPWKQYPLATVSTWQLYHLATFLATVCALASVRLI